jgi:zeta-carotene desaturase
VSAPDVIVIGAGVAGLAAATALAEGGARVLVVEARGILGGRASTYRDAVTGELVDNGQHVILGCYHETFRFLRRVGAEGAVRLQARLEVPTVDRGGTRSVLRCPALPAPLHLLAGIMAWPALGWRDRASAFRMAPALIRACRWAARGRATGPARADETVDAWLDRHGQSRRLRELLWEPLALAALNQDVQSAAAAPFARVVGAVFGGRPAEAAIGIPTVPLSELFGATAERYLDARGGLVRRHAPARLVLAGRKVAGIEVRGERIRAGTVVAAVPWHAWRTLVADEDAGPVAALRAAALARRPSPIVTVNLWLDRTVLDVPFVSLPGRRFQFVFDRTRPDRPGAAHLSLVSSGADDVLRQPSDALVSAAVEELRAAVPEARAATLVRGTVVREPRATFSLAPGEPPRPGTRTPAPGLWLAGDWTDTGLPATIESAALSGHRAAAEILRQQAGPAG